MSNIQQDQQQLTATEVLRTENQQPINNMETLRTENMLINNTEVLSTAGKKREEKQPLTQNKTVSCLHGASANAYFKRMLEHSVDRNLSFRLTQSRGLQKDQWKSVKDPASYTFVQQQPKAVWDKFFGSTEKGRIKTAKRSFSKADLCTVREKDALDRLLGTEAYRAGYTGEDVKDEIFNKDLMNYVDSLTDYRLNVQCLTDDYLSKHMASVYEYTRKLSQYRGMREAYPVFFSSLPETKKIALERLAATADDLKDLIDTHLKLHGIEVRKMGEHDVTGYVKEAAAGNVRERDRAALKAEYENKLNGFISKAFVNEDIELARQYTKDDNLLNETGRLVQALNKQF